MEQALHQRWLGIIFAVVLILTYVVGYNMLASYNLQDAFSGFGFYAKSRTPYIIGAILAVLFAACVLGGGKRLTDITGVLVPVMGVLYILVSLIVIFMNIKIFPSVIANIFRDAFNFKAAFSGFAGSCIMWGIKRGLYSNEAGSAPNAAATADVSHPAKQGLVQMLSVFIDTLLVCSATAFMCLCSGVVPTKEAAGAAYVQASMQQALGSFGPITVAMVLFAFTTLIGNYYYCEGCLKYILRRDPSRGGMLVFRLAATALVFVGAIVSAGLAWDTADMLQGTMVIINIPVILILGNKGVARTTCASARRAKPPSSMPPTSVSPARTTGTEPPENRTKQKNTGRLGRCFFAVQALCHAGMRRYSRARSSVASASLTASGSRNGSTHLASTTPSVMAPVRV